MCGFMGCRRLRVDALDAILDSLDAGCWQPLVHQEIPHCIGDSDHPMVAMETLLRLQGVNGSYRSASGQVRGHRAIEGTAP